MWITEFAESNNYLTETKLGVILETLYPEMEFIHNKIVPNSGLRSRPDYRCEELKLIVEFDGHYHFTNPKTILSDVTKDNAYESMGYTVIRIPYFIQINRHTAKLFFDSSKCGLLRVEDFPQGFITLNAITPASFCSLGVELFYKYWRKYFFSDALGEFVSERNIWLQTVYYGRNPLEVFPLDFVRDYRKLFDEVATYGYPT